MKAKNKKTNEIVEVKFVYDEYYNDSEGNFIHEDDLEIIKEPKLEYGRWYSVSEAMPEEFRELKAPYNNCTWNVVVLKDKEDDCVSINYRYLADEWKWRYEIENEKHVITHWCALPKLEK